MSKICSCFLLILVFNFSVGKPATAEEIPLAVESWKGIEQWIQKQTGKIVVVNIWTTTCSTCLEDFPEFVKLSKKYPKKKVVFLAINCDYDGIENQPPEFYRKDVLKFLQKSKPDFRQVMLNISFIDFLDAIDLSSTPSILVYQPTGKLAKRFDNDDAESEEEEYQLADVQKLVDGLLKSAPKQTP